MTELHSCGVVVGYYVCVTDVLTFGCVQVLTFSAQHEYLNTSAPQHIKMKTQITPYLNFNGKCREAMTFYHECLGGELMLQPVAESPMAAQLPSEAGHNILHSSLTRNDISLMGSDMMGSALVTGNGIGLCLNCNSDEEINAFFNKLAQGGNIKMPLHQTFWGATYGELTDKYGINWMFNYSKN
jgi:PhnB protein